MRANGWTPTSVAARARVILREQGPRSLWFKVLGETVYRRLLVTELRLPLEPHAQRLPPAGMKLRVLRDDELGAYAELRGGDDVARASLARGERCFGAWLDGRLVATQFVAAGSAYVRPLDRTIALRDGDAYGHSAYAATAERRRGLGTQATVAVAAALEREGFTRIVGVLDPENVPGIRMSERAGYRVVGKIGYLKLGPWRRDFGRL